MNHTHAKRKAKLRKLRRRSEPGAAPGSVTPDQAALKPSVRVIAYGPDDYLERQLHGIESLPELVGKHPVIWIDIEGLGDAALVERIGEIFNLHRLALEDVVHTHQRPKIEDYEAYLFIVVRMLMLDNPPDTEQMSIFLGKNFVVTFQEKPGDCLEPVRQRLRKSRGEIRQSGPDHLAYALLDAVVDAYFPVLERYGDWLDRLDDQVTIRPSRAASVELHALRSDLLLLRRAIWPLRDAIGMFFRECSALVSRDTCVYLRDTYDHSVQAIELLETCRELCADLREFHLSSINTRMSEIMKVLTIISTIFMPLAFIAGVYGMNFDPDTSPWNMPELRWYFGYPFALGVMATVAAGLVYYFFRRGWLGRL